MNSREQRFIMLTLNDMAIFATIIKNKSFTKAAQELNLAKSTVSSRLTLLEKKLKTKLLNRTTRTLSLTQAGEILYTHCQQMTIHAQQAEDSLRNHNELPIGKLKITCPEISGLYLFSQLISKFKQQYPLITIQLIITDQFLDITKENIDFAFRTGIQQDSNLICRHLSMVARSIVAAPAYLKNNQAIKKPQDLNKFPLLKHSLLTSWPLFKGSQKQSIAIKNIAVESNSLIFLLDMAVQGHGIALLPRYLSKTMRQQKKLVELLPEWKVPDNDYYLLYPAGNENRFIHNLFKDFILNANLSEKIKG